MFKQIITAAFAIVATAVVSSQTVQAASDTGITTNGSITLTAGSAITLDTAPNLDFGSQPISTTKATYTTSGSTPIQVTNPGFASGWHVSVSSSKFMNGDTELKGAELILNNTTTSAADQTNLSGKAVGLADEAIDADKATIVPGGAALSVLNAAAGDGVGVWNSSWDKVSLDVPAGNVAGDYSATLTWSLDNAPE